MTNGLKLLTLATLIGLGGTMGEGGTNMLRSKLTVNGDAHRGRQARSRRVNSDDHAVLRVIRILPLAVESDDVTCSGID